MGGGQTWCGDVRGDSFDVGPNSGAFGIVGILDNGISDLMQERAAIDRASGSADRAADRYEEVAFLYHEWLASL